MGFERGCFKRFTTGSEGWQKGFGRVVNGSEGFLKGLPKGFEERRGE